MKTECCFCETCERHNVKGCSIAEVFHSGVFVESEEGGSKTAGLGYQMVIATARFSASKRFCLHIIVFPLTVSEYGSNI
jgi:hypothetical protein